MSAPRQWQSPVRHAKTGQPYVFQISAGSQGRWSTFSLATNDSPTIISLITNGNPESLSIGDNVWMAPGVKTDVYSYVPTNKDVMVAVKAASDPGTFQPIVAFAPLHIDYAAGGSGKYIQVHFINNFRFVRSDPGGLIMAPTPLPG